MPEEHRTAASSGWEALAAGAETVWLPTADEMGKLDQEAVASGATTERTLIEAAGREVARRIQLHWPEGPVVAVAGRGHNGADALVALRTLRAWGRDVRAILSGPTPPDPDVLIGWDIPLDPSESLADACAGGRGLRIYRNGVACGFWEHEAECLQAGDIIVEIRPTNLDEPDGNAAEDDVA